jgi:flagellar protein FliS
MSQNASRQYQTQQIMTASPAMLVFMLFEKAIGCLKEAIQAIADNEVEARWRANGRAMEIVSHLQLTLDIDKGGEVALNLDRLYSYMLVRLPKVDIRNDASAAHEVIGLLEPLRDSWRELAKQGDQPQKDAARVTAELACQSPAVAAPVAAAPPPAGRSSTSTMTYSAAGQQPKQSNDQKRIILSA